MKAKNYIVIAGVLRNSYNLIPDDKVQEKGRFTVLVMNLIDYLKTTSPRFNQDKFIDLIYKS